MYRKKILDLLIPLAISIGFGLPSLIYPFGFDQANQAFIGSRLLQGEILFRNVASLKPPFTITFHSLSQLLFGHNMTAIRIADLLWTALICLALIKFFEKAFGQTWKNMAPLSAIMYAHFYYLCSYWNTAQTDGWMNLPLTLAMCLVLVGWNQKAASGLKSFFLWFSVGLLGFVALMFKYPSLGIVFIIFLATYINFRSKLKSGLVAAGGLIAGLVVGVGLLALILSFFKAWEFYLNDHLAGVIRYVGSSAEHISGAAQTVFPINSLKNLFSFDKAVKLFLGAPRTYWIGIAGTIWVLVLMIRKSAKPALLRTYVLVLGWLAGAWISTATQGRFFLYHFLPMFAPLSILSALFLGSFWRTFQERLLSNWAKTAIMIVLIITVIIGNTNPVSPRYFPIPWQWTQLFKVVSGKISIQDNWKDSQYEISKNFPVKDTIEVSAYINEHTDPGDSLFVWGTDMAIYFLTQRPRAVSVVSAPQAVGAAIIPGVRISDPSLYAELQSNPPEILIIQQEDASPHVSGMVKDSFELLKEVEHIYKFFTENYQQKTEIGQFIVMRYLPRSIEVPR